MILALLFLFVLAFAWAQMEIQIEGKNGWAAELPTWRVSDHWLLDLLYGSRPLTGYHVWAFVFVFLALHWPFAVGKVWTWREELRIVGAYNVFWVVEDFLWFLMNPHYGLKSFTRGKIWWHKRWVLGVPLDYWVLGIGGLCGVLLP